jgi:hypothetical protein
MSKPVGCIRWSKVTLMTTTPGATAAPSAG